MNTISTATKELKAGDRIEYANIVFTVEGIVGDELTASHESGDVIGFRGYRFNKLVEVESK